MCDLECDGETRLYLTRMKAKPEISIYPGDAVRKEQLRSGLLSLQATLLCIKVIFTLGTRNLAGFLGITYVMQAYRLFLFSKI